MNVETFPLNQVIQSAAISRRLAENERYIAT